MADPWNHSVSSAKVFGGVPEDYTDIHLWLDESKRFFSDFRHRALRHHSEGVHAAVEKFGPVRRVTGGVMVPVRQIAERHIKEDLGRVPSLEDWLKRIQPEKWMLGRPLPAEKIDLGGEGE